MEKNEIYPNNCERHHDGLCRWNVRALEYKEPSKCVYSEGMPLYGQNPESCSTRKILSEIRR